MANLNAGQKEELTFLTGIDENGAIAKDTYFTWSVGENLGRAWVSKWNNDATGSVRSPTSVAGTGGGTITYAFQEGLSENMKGVYRASLALYSDVANVRFAQVDSVAAANMRFGPATEGPGITFVPSNGSSPTGQGVTQIPSQQSPLTRGGQLNIVINLPDEKFTNFNPSNAVALNTVVHETGHALGLGHGGMYNGSDFDRQNQLGTYDSTLWSIMSYVEPDDPKAKYHSSYPVTGSVRTTVNSGASYKLSSQTPMALDILALERIYGASTSSTFAGGQTYGFNTNISGLSRDIYDFKQNTDPVLTIYNRGTNNTLDLSGYSTRCVIDLNPGTFSTASANGTLVNNICIAYDTRIDKAVGGSGNDTFVTNGNGNVINGGDGRDTVMFAGAKADYAVTAAGDGATLVVNRLTGATDRLTDVEDLQFGAPVCFTTGTRIVLVCGGARIEVAVEVLRAGDVVLTATGGRRAIRWIGHRTLGTGKSRISPAHWPVRVLTGAFGSDAEGCPVPARDLRLSPGHPVLVAGGPAAERGVLVPIMCLVNGTSIARESVVTVTYWHVELDAHDLLLAEGLAAESYIDGGDRAFFAEASDHGLHDPDFVPPGWGARCRPVVVDGPVVEAERRRLDDHFAATLHGACAWSSTGIDWLTAQGPLESPPLR